MLSRFLKKVWMSYPVSWLRCQLTTFELNCQQYHYFCHTYNFTWRNERSVEVPIMWRAVNQAKGKRVLELGNVLSHYFPITHDVVDKYEKAPGVINKDIVSFSPNKKYDLIVSISTLEHVGWDEQKRDKLKTVKALRKMRSLLAKKGKAIISFPKGHNKDLDELFVHKRLKFDAVYFLKRVSADNRWVETSFAEFQKAKYDTPFSNANVVAIGILLG